MAQVSACFSLVQLDWVRGGWGQEVQTWWLWPALSAGWHNYRYVWNPQQHHHSTTDHVLACGQYAQSFSQASRVIFNTEDATKSETWSLSSESNGEGEQAETDLCDAG